MIRAARALALLAVFSVTPAVSLAQSESAPAASVEQERAAGGSAAKAGQQWGDGRAAPGPRPTKEPAKDEPYNWTFMAYSAGAMLIMLAFVVWLVRKSKRRERSA